MTYDTSDLAVEDRAPDEHTANLFDGEPARTADDTPRAPAATHDAESAEGGFTPVTPIDVAEIRDGAAVVQYAATEALLADLRERFEGVRFDLTTKEGAEAAKDASTRLMKLRTGLDKKRKAFKAPALELGKKIDAEAQRITEAIVALETPINDQIAAEKARLAEIEAARLRAEAERRAKFEADIAQIRAYAEHAKSLPSDRIQRGLALVEEMAFGQEWAEFAESAAKAQAETLVAMRALLAAAQAREKAQAEQAAERARLERVAAEQRAEAERLAALAESIELQARRLAEQKAEFEAHERHRKEALRREQEEARARADAEAEERSRAEAAAAAHEREVAAAAAAALAALTSTPALPSEAPQPVDAEPAAVAASAPASSDTGAQDQPVPAGIVDALADAPTIEHAPGPLTFAEPPAPAEDLPPLSIGAINERLKHMKVSAAGLEALGFTPIESKGAAVLFAATEWPSIKAALINHIEGLA
jgi:hypothetical protein